MYVQVVTYRLVGSMADVSDADFIEANQEFAGLVTAVPGLLAKIWLKNADEKVYGGVYLWRDREAYESFLASELWESVVNDDSASDLASHDFAVMEELTKATQPGLQLL
jgi:Putative mono-oxygenase ydhR